MTDTETVKQKFEYILKKYADNMYRIAVAQTGNKSDAEDIVQEVFLKYASSAPVFESDEHEKAWLIRVTINKCKDLLKSAWVSKTETLSDDIAVDFIDAKNDVLETVLSLPIKYRTVIHLFYYEGYSVKKISSILEQNENSTKTQLSRAREMLKKTLNRGDEYAF